MVEATPHIFFLTGVKIKRDPKKQMLDWAQLTMHMFQKGKEEHTRKRGTYRFSGFEKYEQNTNLCQTKQEINKYYLIHRSKPNKKNNFRKIFIQICKMEMRFSNFYWFVYILKVIVSTLERMRRRVVFRMFYQLLSFSSAYH